MDELSCATGNVKVVVRIRPLNSAEKSFKNAPSPLTIAGENKTTLIMATKPEPRAFAFDAVADETSTQEQVFRLVGKQMVEACMQGYNGAIFVYGQTGSGKTFTMHGLNAAGGIDETQKGLVPRTLEHLFAIIARENRKTSAVKYECKASFLEIYNENIYDLLDASSTTLHLREDVKTGVYVEDLKEESVADAEQAMALLNSGVRNRTVAATAMNRESSRSHSVFTLKIESREEKNGVIRVKSSRLHLIDLAGSERQKATGAVGSLLKEASNINKSLSALGNVITALVSVSSGKTRHVPYRDSRLTFLLKDSLGGNSKTCIIANVSPADVNFGETLSTLQFAQRAKYIKTEAKINEDALGSVDELQREIKRLREELSNVAQNGGSGIVDPTLDGFGAGKSGSKSSGSTSSEVLATRNRELEAVLSKALDEAREARDSALASGVRTKNVEELFAKLEKASQSSKMIIKLRDAEIARLRTSRTTGAAPGEGSEDSERAAVEAALRLEIQLLQTKSEHHPESAALSLQVSRLSEELRTVKAQLLGSSVASLDQLRKYNEELAGQLSCVIQEKHKLLEQITLSGGEGAAVAATVAAAGAAVANGAASSSAGGAGTPSKAVLSPAAAAAGSRIAALASSSDSSSGTMSPMRRHALEQFEKERWQLRESYERQFKTLNAELESVKTESERVTAESERLQAELTAANAKIQELSSSLISSNMINDIKVRNLQNQLENQRGGSTRGAARLQEELANVQIENSKVLAKLEQSICEIEALRVQLDKANDDQISLQVKYDDSEASNLALGQKFSELERQAEAQRVAIEKQAAEVASATLAKEVTDEANLKLEAELSRVKRALEAAEEKSQQAALSLEVSESELNHVKTELEEARRALQEQAESTVPIEQKQIAQQEIEELRAQIAALNAKLVDHDIVIAHSNETIVALRQEMAASKTQAQEQTSALESARAELAEYVELSNSLRADIAAREVQLEQLAKMKQECTTLEEKLAKAEANYKKEKENKRAEREAKCAARAELETAKNAVSKLQTQLTEAREAQPAREASQANLASYEELVSRLSHEVETLRKNEDNRRAAFEVQEQMIQNLQSTNARIKAHEEQLAAEVETLRQMTTAQGAEIEKEKETIKELWARYRAANANTKKSDGLAENYKAELAESMKQLETLKSEEQKLFLEARALREECDMLRATRDKHNLQISNLGEQVSKLTEENEKLSGHQNSKQKIHHHQQVKIECNMLKEKNRELTEQLLKRDKIIARIIHPTDAENKDPSAVVASAISAGKCNSTVALGGLPFDIDLEDQLRGQLSEIRARDAKVQHDVMETIRRIYGHIPGSASSATSAGAAVADDADLVIAMQKLEKWVLDRARDISTSERALRDKDFQISMMQKNMVLNGTAVRETPLKTPFKTPGKA